MNPDSFDFPRDAADRIDQQLRKLVEQDADVRSVRPERQFAAKTEIVSPRPIAPPEAPKPANTVPNVTPEPTPVESEDTISIDLPTKFCFYPFKDLYIRPFRGRQLKKLATANATGALQPLVEAVSACLTSPQYPQPGIGFLLCQADFNAVLYWLRLNSFPQKQMRVTSYCTNPDHISKVATGEKGESTLKLSTVFTQADIKTTYLEHKPDPDYFQFVYTGAPITKGDGTVLVSKGDTVRMRPENQMDTIQYLDLPDLDQEEVQYAATHAACLDLPGTLRERMAVIDELEPIQLVKLDEFMAILDSCGVQEIVSTKCTECGASSEVELAVDAPTFLSPSF